MTRRTKIGFDHIGYIQAYLLKTRGLWPRIARELNQHGITATVQSLSALCNAKDPNPLYRKVMELYDYMRGTGKKWIP